MRITVTVPGLLMDCVGGERSFTVEASTLSDALATLRGAYPLLVPHVFDDAGEIRQHVLVYYNDQSVKWLDSLDLPLRAGDRIQIIQAVSGGKDQGVTRGER